MKTTRPINMSPFRHLYPYQSNYIDINGLKYHYLDQGKGDPVVMVHGNPTWSFYFRNLVNELSPQFRTIVPAHIGCGLSDKPTTNQYDYRLKNRIDDLESLLDHLKLRENINLILHDWGGMIGMAYALRHPKRIRRLVIMNTAAFLPPKGKPIPMRLRLVRNIKPLAVLALQGFNLFALSALFIASHKGLDKDVKSGLIAPYNSWKNRIATLKFVQDIPVGEKIPATIWLSMPMKTCINSTTFPCSFAGASTTPSLTPTIWRNGSAAFPTRRSVYFQMPGTTYWKICRTKSRFWSTIFYKKTQHHNG